MIYQEKFDYSNFHIDQHRLARLLAASQPHFGRSLDALPSAAVNTLSDNGNLSIRICICLGSHVRTPDSCMCGVTINKYGLHPLSYRLGADNVPRHSNLNDAVRWTLVSDRFPSNLEPIGLDRGDCKRPDGITLGNFIEKCLISDCALCKEKCYYR